MSCNSERTEGAEVPSIFNGDQAEWDNNQEHGFLVDVPPKQKRRVRAKSDGAHERLPGWSEPELEQRQLYINQHHRMGPKDG